MMTISRSALRAKFKGLVHLYRADDADTIRLRAALLGSVLRLTPYTMASNIGSGLMVLWCFRAQVPVGLWVWWGLLLLVSTAATLGWWRSRHRPRVSGSRRTMHRATVHTLLLASIWAVVPLVWFADAAPAQQMLVATLVTGLLGAGAYVLSPLPVASLVWVLLFTVGALGALWQSGDPALAGVAVLLGFFSPTVAIGSLSASRKHAHALRTQARAEQQERMLAVLLQDFEQNADEALWQTGIDGHLTHHSPRLASLLGVGEDALHGVPLLKLLQRQVHTGLAELQAALDAGTPFRDLGLSITIAGAGDERHLAINGKRLLDEQGRTLGWRGVLSDITERVAAQQQLRQLAHTDSLTGLANRHTLRSALTSTLQQGRPAALLSIDLDHFKAVNDTLGHTAGDEVLRAVSARLRECMRPLDLVARLGGDEFAVLMPEAVRADDATALAQRLIESLSLPIDVGGRRLRVGASVGVALCDGSADGVDELLVRADMALYAAKDLGRGRHAVYVPAMGESNRRRTAIEQGLRHAVERGQLALHWQPKVDIEDWKIVGAEALMRWQHPELGAIGPAEFIVVAEQCGLIDQIGHWALREACRAATGPLAGLVVSVNVSPVQLRDAHYISRLRDALREFGLDASRLELEITESVFMGDIDDALERLRAIRSLGIRIALDDFGTGYSSLAYLRRFPFDTLKIDRAFVSEVLLRKDARAIVHTIAQMASILGMRTVSEGVETVQQLAAVAQAGCHEVQGYLISPPRPLREFAALQRAWPTERPSFTPLH